MGKLKCTTKQCTRDGGEALGIYCYIVSHVRGSPILLLEDGFRLFKSEKLQTIVQPRKIFLNEV